MDKVARLAPEDRNEVLEGHPPWPHDFILKEHKRKG